MTVRHAVDQLRNLNCVRTVVDNLDPGINWDFARLVHLILVFAIKCVEFERG